MNIKKTKAAILVEQNKPLLIDYIDLPNKLDYGQILVKVDYSGICGSQLGEIDGVKGKDPYLPHLLGHEGVGTVIEVGKGVKTVKKSDRVVLHWKKSSGIESQLPIYKLKDKKINAGWVTTFNQYSVVSENRCTSVSKKIDLKFASLFGCAITTAFGAVENKAKLKIGENILVYGSGGIGLNIIQAAKLYSANKIIAIDLHDNKLELAKKLGASHTINSKKSDIQTALDSILDGESLDVFFDNTGKTEVIEFGYRYTSETGRVILIGVPKKGDNIEIFSLKMHFGKTITGTHGGDGNVANDIPRYLRLVLDKKLDLSKIVTDIYELDDINQAIQDIRSGKVSGRCVIKL
tara:strand:+ start:477 stop:1523 length:1047 start_codon:yes stop_codon:yes gene_type:complete